MLFFGKKEKPDILSGVLAALATLMGLRGFIVSLCANKLSVDTLVFWGRSLDFVFFAVVAILCFVGRKNSFATVLAFCLYALFELLTAFGLSSLFLVAACLLVAIIIFGSLKEKPWKISKLWFLPGILAAVGYLIPLIQKFIWFNSFSPIGYDFVCSVSECAVFFVLLCPVRKTEKKKEKTASGEKNVYIVSPGKQFALTVFTFGIWPLMWIYRTTRLLNEAPDEEYRSPAKKLLLCMFIPFYSLYWTYKSAQRIDKLSASLGLYSRLTGSCLVLAIFFGVLPPFVMQGQINNILTVKRAEPQA